MRLTHETLSTLISTHVIKVFGAETVEWVSIYFIIWPGPWGLCTVVASFILLSSSPLPMRMQSALTLWPGVKGKRGNQMWHEAATLGAVRHKRSARSPAKTCKHINTHLNNARFHNKITILCFDCPDKGCRIGSAISIYFFIKDVLTSWSQRSCFPRRHSGSIFLWSWLLLP